METKLLLFLLRSEHFGRGATAVDSGKHSEEKRQGVFQWICVPQRHLRRG